MPPELPPVQAPGPVLEWTVHLARDRPGRAAVVVLTLLLAAGLCFTLFRSPLFALLTAAVLLGATSEFLLPIRYRLDNQGAESANLHNRRRISWRDVRKAYLLEDGIQLSPFDQPTRLEAFRGVFLRFGPGGDRETVLAAVRERREAARAGSGAIDG
jgi:hypothetical protein